MYDFFEQKRYPCILSRQCPIAIMADQGRTQSPSIQLHQIWNIDLARCSAPSFVVGFIPYKQTVCLHWWPSHPGQLESRGHVTCISASE